MSYEPTPEHIDTVHDLVEAVAHALPFPTGDYTEPDGTAVFQIDLGTRGGRDDPCDRAGIDAEDGLDAKWWIDIEGGMKTIASDYGLDASPQTVAAWITRVARAEGCPAASPAPTLQDKTRRRPPATDTGPHTGPIGPSATGPTLG